ncbi:YfzA family protein [Paenibacillus sp. KN14-4R]|uniref:YfzA family protein n=1 Tax=Paenibacillus sp. KN14-4R TaxID=3445773 RepID=UPI003FA12C3C
MQKGRPIRIRGWVATLVAFLVLQLIFLVIDNSSGSPFYFEQGTILGRLSNSKFFTEEFAPYKTLQFNVYTVFLAIALLPGALISAIKDFSRK